MKAVLVSLIVLEIVAAIVLSFHNGHVSGLRDGLEACRPGSAYEFVRLP